MKSPVQSENVVDPFNRDVDELGRYQYTGDKKSCVHANRRDSDLILRNASLDGKKVLDIGCGDGTYTIVLHDESRPLSILGIDPAFVAIERAKAVSSERKGLSFRCGFTRDLVAEREKFDLAVLRGVLHHTADPEREIADAFSVADKLVILEPNGWNLGLKYLERYSRYHVEHGERSFRLGQLRQWICRSGGQIDRVRWSGLVPYFSPDWFVSLAAPFEPITSAIPIARQFICGSQLIIATANRETLVAGSATHERSP